MSFLPTPAAGGATPSREVRLNGQEILVLSGRVLELLRDGDVSGPRVHVDHVAVRTERADDGGLVVELRRRAAPDDPGVLSLRVPARRIAAVQAFLQHVEEERLKSPPLPAD